MHLRSFMAPAAVTLLMGIAIGCGTDGTGTGTTGKTVPPVLDKVFLTALDVALDIDSPAAWHGPGGEHWLLVTAKESDGIVVYDALTGGHIKTIGTSGTAPGQFERPNGIAVVDNVMIVVERDNHRVQILSLPGGEPLGTFGDDILVRPYGITVVETGGALDLYITDNYETPDEMTPPDAELGERVKRFRCTVTDSGVEASFTGAFGDISGAGVLHTVESIFADPGRGVLLIADEHDGDQDIKVYTLDGQFTGTVFGQGIFNFEPEGIALYETANGGGYWFTTDQDHVDNVFHLFDRATYDHAGAFSGAFVRNTDGIALTQYAFDEHPRGLFYAVHSDSGVCAYDIGEVLDTLGLTP